ncbi:MAG: response regulator [Pyrinomonadaceae bacterium]
MDHRLTTVLCVDRDPDSCELYAMLLGAAGYEVEISHSPADAIALLGECRFAAVVMGYYFSGSDGPELCRQFRRFDSRTPVIFFSGAATTAERAAAEAAGAQAYLIKPNGIDDLVDAIRELTGESASARPRSRDASIATNV